jgi:hypothetical protein
VAGSTAREETPLAILTATEEPVEDPHLRRILDDLDPQHRLIVELMYDGYSASEVLQRLGWGPEQKSRLYRLLHNFRTRYLRQHPDRVRLVRDEIDRLREAAGAGPFDAIEQELEQRSRPADVVHIYRMVHRTRKRLGKQTPAERAIELDDLLTRLRLDAASGCLRQQVRAELSRVGEHLVSGQRNQVNTINRELNRRKLSAEQLARVGRELFRIRKAFCADRRRLASRLLVTLSLELGLHPGNDRLRRTAERVRDLLLDRLDGTQARRARDLLNPLLDSPAPAVWLRLLRLGKKKPVQPVDLLAGLERICRPGSR